MSILKAVVDTNVVFEGLTKQGGASDVLIKAWLGKAFLPCIGNAMTYEYLDVLARKLNKQRWQKIEPTLYQLINLCEYTQVSYRWRPSSPDVNDDHVVDLVMNANCSLVTLNLKDFKLPSQELGFEVLTPAKFVNTLSAHLKEKGTP